MLGLAAHLPDVATSFVSFREGDRCQAFLREVRRSGYIGSYLSNDTPYLRRAFHELCDQLQSCDVLLCHGYKANLLGRLAARRRGIPAIAVSRGWTGESRKVRLYERLDRWHLRYMDRVIAVSEGQAARVRRAGVDEKKLIVIRNAARLNAFVQRSDSDRKALLARVPGCAGSSSPRGGSRRRRASTC